MLHVCKRYMREYVWHVHCWRGRVLWIRVLYRINGICAVGTPSKTEAGDSGKARLSLNFQGQTLLYLVLRSNDGM